MNGLICYRIAGGELTDIVASYDGVFTIEPENYRNHTTKITITGSNATCDVLNVAIRITTDGKSVLHKSTRIICKDGVITAYDFGLVELGDDTDLMIELSNALTEYLTKPAVLVSDAVVPVERIDIQQDKKLLENLGNALGTYLNKSPVSVSDAVIPVVQNDIQPDDSLKTLGNALETYLTKSPVSVSDAAVIPMGQNDVLPDGKLLQTLGDALGTYLKKTDVSVSDAVIPMGKNEVLQDKTLLQTLGDALGTYLTKTPVLVSDAVIPMERIEVSQDKKLLQTLGDALGTYLTKHAISGTQETEHAITDKFFEFLRTKLTGRMDGFNRLSELFKRIKDDETIEDEGYNFRYTKMMKKLPNTEELGQITLPLSMHYNKDDFIHINNPAIFNIWRAINGEQINNEPIDIKPNINYCKLHLIALASELKTKQLNTLETALLKRQIIEDDHDNTIVNLYITMKRLLIDDTEYELHFSEFVVKMLYYVYCIKDRVSDIQMRLLAMNKNVSLNDTQLETEPLDIGDIQVEIENPIETQKIIISERKRVRDITIPALEQLNNALLQTQNAIAESQVKFVSAKKKPTELQNLYTENITKYEKGISEIEKQTKEIEQEESKSYNKYTTDRQTLEETAKKYKQWKYSFSLPFELFEFRYGKIDYIDRNDPRARFIECIEIYIAKDEDEQPISNEEQIDALMTEIGNGQFVGLQPDLVEP